MIPSLRGKNLTKRVEKGLHKRNESELLNAMENIAFLEDFSNDQEISILNCSHIFHYNCIYRSFMRKPECPLCRDNLLKYI